MMAWTTTPWTLPSNTALAVGKEIKYIKVRSFNPYSGDPITVIIAKELLNASFLRQMLQLNFLNTNPVKKRYLLKFQENFPDLSLKELTMSS